jgi:hypothetical protein
MKKFSAAPEETVTPIAVNTRNYATNQQLEMLKGVMGMAMTGMGIARQPLPESVEKHPMTGEAAVAAETTFIKACEAIDRILDDTKRWDSSFQDRMEKIIDDTTARNARLVEAQIAGIESVKAPHRVWPVSMHRLNSGYWAVCIGNDIEKSEGLIGVGTTAQEAVDAFDALFKGVVPESLKTWLEKNKNESEQLDGTRTEDTGNNASSGLPGVGDSDGAGPNLSSGDESNPQG